MEEHTLDYTKIFIKYLKEKDISMKNEMEVLSKMIHYKENELPPLKRKYDFLETKRDRFLSCRQVLEAEE